MLLSILIKEGATMKVMNIAWLVVVQRVQLVE